MLRASLFKAAIPFLALVATVAACKTGNIPIGQDQQPVACASTSDCPGGDVCAEGFCIAACTADADCTAGTVCVSGVCQLPGTCASTVEICDGLDNDCDGVVDNGATCPGSSTCVNGQCVAAGCTADADCPPNQSCVSGVCQSNTTCTPSAEVCDGLDNDCDGMIDNGATCPGGTSCVNGQCLAAGACTADADCPAMSSCVAGQCQACGCGDGFCAPACGETPGSCPFDCGAPPSCAADADCGANAVCNAGLCGCLPGFEDVNQNVTDGCEYACVGFSAEVCDGIDNDCNGFVDDLAPCPGNSTCFNGQCVVLACASNADCPPQLFCQSGFCAP